jgi:AmmeMemoRadiSam system protein B
MVVKREPAAAGLFYPLNKLELEARLEKLFDGVEGKSNCQAVISPHAGYDYSGKTAAVAISALKPADKFIVLGNNHYLRGAEFAAMGLGTWETPLGSIQIDRDLSYKILRSQFMEDSELAHEREHSIEVQLPLLQHRFKNFTFVPVSIMNVDYSPEFLGKCDILGKNLANMVKGKSVGIVASSDFSHYISESLAKEKDDEAIEQILKLDSAGLFKTLSETQASVCGYGPIAVLLSMAKELGLKPKLLHSSTSADAGGPKSKVVTYHSVGFE